MALVALVRPSEDNLAMSDFDWALEQWGCTKGGTTSRWLGVPKEGKPSDDSRNWYGAIANAFHQEPHRQISLASVAVTFGAVENKRALVGSLLRRETKGSLAQVVEVTAPAGPADRDLSI